MKKAKNKGTVIIASVPTNLKGKEQRRGNILVAQYHTSIAAVD
jgi:hypothetical protein